MTIACVAATREAFPVTFMSDARPSPPPLPVDRGHVATEQRHERSAALDQLETRALVNLMADDHRAVVSAVEAASAPIAALIDAVALRVAEGGRLIYLGAGTSGRLGVLDASECPPTFQSDPGTVVGIIAGGDAALRRSSEGAEDDEHGAEPALAALAIGPRDTVVGIAAGGTTPYVLGALRHATAHGALTALVTCAEPIERGAIDHLILLRTGPEVLTGSTRLKAGSATKLALNILSTGLFVKLGKVHGNLMVDLRASNAKLRDRAIRTLQALDQSLSREDAAILLDDADQNVKCAAVMRQFGISRAAAEARLRDVNGVLRHAIAHERST